LQKEEQAKKERAAESKKNQFSSQKGGRGGNKGATGGRGRSGSGRKENGHPAKTGPKQEQAQKGATPAAQPAAEPKEAPPASALPPRSGRTMADLFKKPARQQQPPERQRESQLPKEKPATTAAPQTSAIPEATEKQVSDNKSPTETEVQQVGNAWGKPVASGQQAAVPAPQQPAAPQTGLATSLMSALGAGNPPKNQSSGLQHPNTTQNRMPENEQRGQPGSTFTGNDVGLNLQFGNFGLGSGNDFGSGFGSTFETQPGTAAQAGQQPQTSSATGQDPKQTAFSSFQENQNSTAGQGAPKQQMDAQQMQQQAAHQYGYSAYAGAGGYWPATGRQPQPQPQQALAQQQLQQPQQPQQPKSGKVENAQGQQAHAAATMMPYGAHAPAIGGMGQYTQFGFPQYAYQYAQYPAGYYPPQYYPAPQGSQYPPQPGSSGQAPRVPSGGANAFGLYGEEQAVNYQQAPAPGGNYPGQAPAYNYGQYGR